MFWKISKSRAPVLWLIGLPILVRVQAKFHQRFVHPQKDYRLRLLCCERSSSSKQDTSHLFRQHVANDDHSDQPYGQALGVGSDMISWRGKEACLYHALSTSGGASVLQALSEEQLLEKQEQNNYPMAPTVTIVPATMGTAKVSPYMQNLVKAKKIVGEKIQRFVAVSAPMVLAICGIRRRNAPSKYLMSFGSIYVWSLIGSSAGFYIFLYFISIGYALGIGLPILVTLGAYFRYQQSLCAETIIHATFVLLWSVRLMTFLLYREHYGWPALHVKIVRVNQEQLVGVFTRILCWLCYSFLYVCMLLPCWLRMEESSRTNVQKRVSRLGIGLQMVGLITETVADYQKSRFKSKHRLSWCREGLWNYSTNPNYAGEWLFWLGTYIAGGKSRNTTERLLQMVGFSFISIVLYGAAEALAKKQTIKYGEAYRTFRSKHTIFGPKLLQQRLNRSHFDSNVAVMKQTNE